MFFSHVKQKINDEQFLLYEHFVERLNLNDIIFTFNYDTILEKALTRKNIPYRFYDYRQRYDERAEQLVLDWKDEIRIFKMHGSINWFDKTHYEEEKERRKGDEFFNPPPDAAFDGRVSDKIHRLLDEPFYPNDPFRNIYFLDNLEKYFEIYFDRTEIQISQAPFIIPPSYQKLAYLNILREYWHGFSKVIFGANSVAIIGFSLPAHDEYIRQPMYWYIKNFHSRGELLRGKKSKLKIIDYKKSIKEIDDFKEKYRFVDKAMTDFYFGGFCDEALDIIFAED